ncbi:hypothetical protein U2150_00590 [Methanothermobacter wolfeii]|uniref:Uncharacterized protein n=1 Tax=Methanothermobacter wolfeii TaxID=145261 RepID=A0ABU8TSJ9_METWO|nr:putative protein {ECO:0000313/EMBL:ADL59311,1} [Methanothermobacter wolfeii]
MKQFLITPAAGKRLIAVGMAHHPAIRRSLKKGMLVIIAGTTNGYIAEEVLRQMGEEGFSREGFHRGITVPPWVERNEMGRAGSEFPGDVVIRDGEWQRGLTIFDVADELGRDDVVLKGANALDFSSGRAAVYIGHPAGGTILSALQAVVGRRTRLIIPVGLEKMVPGDLDEIALKLNSPDAEGPRMLPIPGEVFTEVDAIRLLTGAEAHPVAAGGVCGAEGSVYLLVEGEGAEKIIGAVESEPPYAESFFRDR